MRCKVRALSTTRFIQFHLEFDDGEQWAAITGPDERNSSSSSWRMRKRAKSKIKKKSVIRERRSDELQVTFNYLK